MKIHFSIYLICAFGLLAGSCKKYVEVDLPKDQVLNELAFTDDKTATASMVGVYSGMNGLNYYFANVLTSVMSAMSADELYYAANYQVYQEFTDNHISTTNSLLGTLWSQPYAYIYQANAVIEGLEKADGPSEAVKSQLTGEAKFLRAFCHFYLTNMFGGVPLILSTDYSVNTALPRTSKTEVLQAVIEDLSEAKDLLIGGYAAGADVSSGNGERIRPNKWAATALLARAYLYAGQWAEAEAAATEVMNSGVYQLMPTGQLNAVFLANSEEAIWQLQAVNVLNGRNTWEGFLLLPASPTATPFFRLLPGGLADAFEEGDVRKAAWTGSYTSGSQTYLYPYKYKIRMNVSPAQEYSMVMRYAELFLIRAEARLRQGKLEEARVDLNVIRERAGLADLGNNLSERELWLAMERERQVELSTEWGHRWFDLCRWEGLDGAKTRADEVLGNLKTSWQSTAVLFPIPLKAVQTNTNLDQNPGY